MQHVCKPNQKLHPKHRIIRARITSFPIVGCLLKNPDHITDPFIVSVYTSWRERLTLTLFSCAFVEVNLHHCAVPSNVFVHHYRAIPFMGAHCATIQGAHRTAIVCVTIYCVWWRFLVRRSVTNMCSLSSCSASDLCFASQSKDINDVHMQWIEERCVFHTIKKEIYGAAIKKRCGYKRMGIYLITSQFEDMAVCVY